MPVSHRKKAGSLVTTDYLTLPAGTSVEIAIVRLREQAPNLKIIHYIYIVDRENILEGVVSIRNLFMASSHQTLAEIGNPKLIKIMPEGGLNEVSQAFLKYKFQALPVLDKGNHLKGVISFGTLLDVLLKKTR